MNTLLVLAVFPLIEAAHLPVAVGPDPPSTGQVTYPNEDHLTNVRQLTFGGMNAEAYFSFDDKKLTFQATGYGTTCDQIYQYDLVTNDTRRVSTGLGVTTCSFFLSDNQHFIYAGTFHNQEYNQSRTYADTWETCPKKQCTEPIADDTLRQLCNTDYTWDIFPGYDIFLADKFGNIVHQLTDTPGYDAEGVLSPDGQLIAFTSMRSGDLELWIMGSDGSNPRQVTNVTGYDGGSFFSPDGQKLIFRASRPKTQQEIDRYKLLLKYDLVAPTEMELFRVNIDGTGMEQITHLGGASWAPYYLPDNKRIIFSSDYNNTAGFGAFDLWVIDEDGSNLTRITHDDGQFDAFPMFSRSGKQLVWGSSRNGSQYDLNLFIADWIDDSTDGSHTTSFSIITLILVYFIVFQPQ